MIRKSQLFLAVAALVGMNAAMAACNTTQWGQGSVTAVVGTPTPGNPTAADADGQSVQCTEHGCRGQHVLGGLERNWL